MSNFEWTCPTCGKTEQAELSNAFLTALARHSCGSGSVCPDCAAYGLVCDLADPYVMRCTPGECEACDVAFDAYRNRTPRPQVELHVVAGPIPHLVSVDLCSGPSCLCNTVTPGAPC